MDQVVISQGHAPQPIEHFISMDGDQGGNLRIEWTGESKALHFTMTASSGGQVRDGAILEVSHDYLEAFFAAYLQSRGYNAMKAPERMQADRAEANSRLIDGRSLPACEAVPDKAM